MKKEHQNYLTPSVETMKVRVEKGFAGSGGGGSTSGFPGLPGRQGLPFT